METVKRILQDKISNRIAPGKAVLIFGARRVGKTVMMRQIVDGYPGRTMMLNGEDYDTLAIVGNRTMANYRHVLEGIDLLAIDEAQNIPQIGSILKLIVDELPGCKRIGKRFIVIRPVEQDRRAVGRPQYAICTYAIFTARNRANGNGSRNPSESRSSLDLRLLSGGGDDG